MVGLLLKDTINILKGIKLIIIVVIIYGAISFTGGDTSFFATMFTMVFALYVLNTYTYDTVAKWDIYALTLPITRKMIVKSKYCFMLMLSATSVIICFIVTVVLNLLLKKSALQGTGYIFIGIITVIFAYSIIIPLVTKLGVEKARVLMGIVIVAPYVSVAYVAKDLQEGKVELPAIVIELGSILSRYSYLIVPIILAFMLYISYRISVRIYEKKEF